MSANTLKVPLEGVCPENQDFFFFWALTCQRAKRVPFEPKKYKRNIKKQVHRYIYIHEFSSFLFQGPKKARFSGLTAPPPPPALCTEQFRNQQRCVKCIKYVVDLMRGQKLLCSYGVEVLSFSQMQKVLNKSASGG
jgi:hypothetical protein